MHLLGFLLVALAAVSCCQAKPECKEPADELYDFDCSDLVDLTPLTAALGTTTKPLKWLRISESRFTLKREDIDTPRMLDIVKLDLSENGWTSFNSEPIQVLTKLRELQLSDNILTAITANTLAGLESLTLVSFFSNQIETIDPAAFRSLTRLYQLDLRHNRLSTIPPGLFRGLPLRSLKLSNNVLTSIDELTFDGLTKLGDLYVSKNQIETIDPAAFQSLTALTQLDLDDNRISTLPPGAFSGLPLFRLELGGNLLTRIDEETFNNLPKLAYLLLAKNKIRTINSRAFQTLPALTMVQLDDNELESLDSRLLENSKVIGLVLKGNNLNNLANFPLNSTSLLALSLNECNITLIPDDYFKNVPNIYTLGLKKNQINTLQPGWLSPLTNLRILSLKSNNLTSLNVASFEQIHQLLISPERSLKLSQYFYFPLPTRSQKPIVDLEGNPWDRSTPDMVELKAWCEQHAVDFGKVFPTKRVVDDDDY